ncbi:metalloregulator ArsR/SmtB family transcription factor [Cellulomonas sp. NTE-D12]|uniref:ArsR/SmtB family transcription factor n=1 Tax=Cellulomonas sp. NTE-D12 TaxID=2962632 RepID=UPI003081BDD5
MPWDVLGDASRRQIMSVLAQQPSAVGELADRLPISRPAVSQHLRVLKDAGVVVGEVKGTRRVYRVDAVALSAMKDQMDTFWQRTLAGFSEVAQESADSKQRKAKGLQE